MKNFEEVKFYHVLRHFNQLADHEANRGTSLSKGVISVNGAEIYEPIPLSLGRRNRSEFSCQKLQKSEFCQEGIQSAGVKV
jgi:hypothetical protein